MTAPGDDGPQAKEVEQVATEATAAESGAAPASDEGAAASTSSAEPQASKKKRRSDIQLNKDDHPHGHECDDDDGELNDEGGKRSDPFKKAPEDVLKKRKIVKASSKWSSGGGGTSKGGGAFAAVKLVPAAKAEEEGAEKDTEASKSDVATSVFGSSASVPTFGSSAKVPTFGSAAGKSGGFAGFGALTSSAEKADAKEEGAISSPPKSTGFGGGGFGSGFGAVSNGFGSLKSSTTSSFGFGSTPKSADAPADSATSGLAGTFAQGKKSPNSPSKFPTNVVDTANGEQDEDCLCQVRAKLFKMVPEEETTAATGEDGGALKEDVPSVPSTKRLEMVKAKKDDGEEGASPVKAKGSSEAEGGGEKKPKLVQKEAGIGPVRVLRRKAPIVLDAEGIDDGKESEESHAAGDARVVQRQETSLKLILNVRLVPNTCTVVRRGDKFLQLNAPGSDGHLESSLFKVKTTADADTLEKNLKAVLEVEEK